MYSLLSNKLEISARMKHQVDLNSPQSPAGRAPTVLISNVGARPAGDVSISKERRNIAPMFHSTAMKLSFMRQQ